MSLLREDDRQAIKEDIASLKIPVRLLVFTQESECQYCRETRQLAEEVSDLSDRIILEIYDLKDDIDVAELHDVDKIPALVVMRGGDEPKDFGIRFFGIPSGYEFGTLIEDIKMIGSGTSGLSEKTRGELATLASPIHFQVFVTPTCPYCPRAVLLAHQMAMESDLIRADMVEAIECRTCLRSTRFAVFHARSSTRQNTWKGQCRSRWSWRSCDQPFSRHCFNEHNVRR